MKHPIRGSRVFDVERFDMLALFCIALTLLAVILLSRSISSRLGAAVVALGVFAVLFLVFAYLVLNTVTGAGIDESVLFHLRAGMEGAAFVDYSGTILAGVALALTAVAVAVFSYRWVRTRAGGAGSMPRMAAGVVVLLGALAVNPAVLDIVALFQKYGGATGPTAQEAAQPDDFVQPDALRFRGDKENVVLVYLESIERTFLDEELFPGLTPNLSALEKQALSFTDVTQASWASWTIAGMVASQCGIPISSSGAGSDEFLPGATCLGDLLADAGYDLSYLGGASLDFAGKGTFYKTHGFATVEGRDELRGELDDPDYTSIWGIYDDSLFGMATERFDTLAEAGGPFGLAMITVDTHHPSGGIVSQACDDVVYGDGNLKYLNAVHCADMMAGDFIRHILESPVMKDTVLIVLSDHVARPPNVAIETLDKGQRRNLFLAFGPGIEPGTVDTPGATIDAGPTILGLLGAKTEAMGFGRDLLGTEPTLRAEDLPLDDLLGEHWAFLASLWSFPQLQSGIVIDTEADEASLGDRFVKLPAMFELNEDLKVTDILYDVDSENPLVNQVVKMWFGSRFVWIDRCAAVDMVERVEGADPGQYCLLAGSFGSPGTQAMTLTDGEAIGFERLASIFDGIVPSESHYAETIGAIRTRVLFNGARIVELNRGNGLAGDFAVRSAGGQDTGDSWIMNLDAGEKVYLRRGLTLLGVTPDEPPVKLAYKDTCGWGEELFDPDVGFDGSFGATLEADAEDFGAFVVVSDSSAVCYDVDPQLDAVFAGTDFTAWEDIWYEQPYVAVVTRDGQAEEFVGDRNTALGVMLSGTAAEVGD